MADWISDSEEGVVLRLKIQPGASKNQVIGPYGTPSRMKVKIAAPPVDGKANEVLVEYLGKLTRTPKSRWAILRGETGRQKDVLGMGLSARLIQPIFEGEANGA